MLTVLGKLIKEDWPGNCTPLSQTTQGPSQPCSPPLLFLKSLPVLRDLPGRVACWLGPTFITEEPKPDLLVPVRLWVLYLLLVLKLAVDPKGHAVRFPRASWEGTRALLSYVVRASPWWQGGIFCPTASLAQGDQTPVLFTSRKTLPLSALAASPLNSQLGLARKQCVLEVESANPQRAVGSTEEGPLLLTPSNCIFEDTVPHGTAEPMPLLSGRELADDSIGRTRGFQGRALPALSHCCQGVPGSG